VDSVAGLRQILTNISAADDDENNPSLDNHTPGGDLNPSLDSKPSDDSRQTLDSAGEVKHAPDVQSADMNSPNTTEMDEKSDEKLENTLETEIKHGDIDGMLTDEAEMEEKKMSRDDEGISELETKLADGDKAMVPETETHRAENNTDNQQTSEMDIKSADGAAEKYVEMMERDAEVISDVERKCVDSDELSDGAKVRDEDENAIAADEDVNEDNDEYQDAAVSSADNTALGELQLTNQPSDAVAAASDAECRSSSLSRICADYDDVDQVRINFMYVCVVVDPHLPKFGAQTMVNTWSVIL